jgi:hypothetical protein
MVETNFHDVHESVHRDATMKGTNKMQLYRLIYYSWSALNVSGDVFAHHQKHLTVFTVSGSIHPSNCRLVSLMSWNSTNSTQTPAGSHLGEYVQILYLKSSALDDGRKHRPKHVELTRNNKLTCKVASCWFIS